MAVLRRDGDWRLEEVEPGVYEIARGDWTELKVVSGEYDAAGMVDAREDISVPVREVETRADVEALFEDVAAGEHSADPGRGAPGPIGDVDDAADPFAGIPLGLVLVVGLGGGAAVLWLIRFDVTALLFLLGAFLLAIGLLAAVGATYRLLADGRAAALELLVR